MRKNVAILLGLGLLLAWSAGAGAKTIRVPDDYPTIQQALDAAVDGDTVQVAAGTYVENLVWDTKSLTLQGAGARSTIVDGNWAGSCLTLTNVPDTARIAGFTFQNGLGSSDHPGGGLYLDHSAPTITNNEITGNTVILTGGGGGLCLYYSDATLTGNTISDNSAFGGGGVILFYSGATLADNIISGNSVDATGGGLYLAYSEVTLIGNMITENSAADVGGGLFLDESDVTLTGNIISDNTSNISGGGLILMWSDVTLTGNIISNNSARDHGGGIYLHLSAAILTNNLLARNAAATGGGVYLYYKSSPYLLNNTIADNTGEGVKQHPDNPGSPTITNCILWGNGGEGDLVNASATYSDIGTGNKKGKGNISEDPRFVGGGDYHLRKSSLCINRGKNAAPGLPDTDMDGEPRIMDGTVDMGADEFAGASMGSISGTVTDAKTGQPLAKVKVTLYDSGSKVATTKTDSDGYYEFTDLPAETYQLKFKKKGYQPATVKNVVVPPDQEVNVALKKKGKSLASIAWVAPPRPQMAAGESQTVRWRVTGEECDGTALVCSASKAPTAPATGTTPGVEVAPGEYKATLRPVSPGTWHYAAVAEVDGDTVATRPVTVTVK